eukprot:4296632-Heterocapsa_arctica.AAC.1
MHLGSKPSSSVLDMKSALLRPLEAEDRTWDELATRRATTTCWSTRRTAAGCSSCWRTGS